MQKARRWFGSITLGAVVFFGGYAGAVAQPGPLPTAPAASKVATDPERPMAPASIPGYGGSPLEPWLIVWLLPVSGLLSVIVATAVDRAVRARRI